MRVLRSNKESLMAVLEAFVYDPLITWRLIKTENGGRDRKGAVGESVGLKISIENSLPSRC